MICPTCNGAKRDCRFDTAGRFASRLFLTCPDCNATGEVDDRYPEWEKIGRKMCEDRISRDGSLREEARERRISVVKLSRMERGFEEPKPRQLSADSRDDFGVEQAS